VLVCAGRFESNGTFVYWTDAANDAYDTMAWAVAQSWSNGRIASTGISANAIAAYMQPLATPAPPPWLVAQFNMVGQALLHDATYQGGAYR